VYQLMIANKNYSSWSLRPWLLMKACGIPFEEVMFYFDPTSNWEQFRQFSPTGKVPCLRDGHITVWDSLGITEYLAERHPHVWPADPEARAWARCAAAEMHSGFGALRDICSMSIGIRVTLHNVPAALTADLTRIDELWCEGLSRFGGPFLAGNQFSAVDAFFAPVAFRLQTYGLSLSDTANAYTRQLLAMPAMQQWQADALAETVRDEPHEKDTLNHGVITADYRATA
jgi:glutathione S-transferase